MSTYNRQDIDFITKLKPYVDIITTHKFDMVSITIPGFSLAIHTVHWGLQDN